MRVLAVLLVAAVASTALAGQGAAADTAPSPTVSRESTTPQCESPTAENSAGLPPTQVERLVSEFDAESDDAGRPGWTSPVEPGDPCDDWG